MKQKQKWEVHRGDIFYVKIPYYVTGSEQGGRVRPAVVLSNEQGNANASIVEIVYLTKTHRRNDLPTHVEITSTKYPSIALCEQITSVSVSRLIKHLGRVTEQELKEMEGACAVSLGIGNLDWLVHAYWHRLRGMRRELRKLKDSLSEATANIAALSPGLQTKTMREESGTFCRDRFKGSSPFWIGCLVQERTSLKRNNRLQRKDRKWNSICLKTR